MQSTFFYWADKNNFWSFVFIFFSFGRDGKIESLKKGGAVMFLKPMKLNVDSLPDLDI